VFIDATGHLYIVSSTQMGTTEEHDARNPLQAKPDISCKYQSIKKLPSWKLLTPITIKIQTLSFETNATLLCLC